MNKKTSRRPNYRSASTKLTRLRQATIAELLALLGEGLTVAEIGRALGMSRQLCLYHVKKMAASGLLVMQLEACLENGGVRFRVWSEVALAAHYARIMPQLVAQEVRRAA